MALLLPLPMDLFSACRLGWGVGNVAFQLLAQALDIACFRSLVDGHLGIQALQFALDELQAGQLGLGGIAEAVEVVFVAVDCDGGHGGGVGSDSVVYAASVGAFGLVEIARVEAARMEVVCVEVVRAEAVRTEAVRTEAVRTEAVCVQAGGAGAAPVQVVSDELGGAAMRRLGDRTSRLQAGEDVEEVEEVKVVRWAGDG